MMRGDSAASAMAPGLFHAPRGAVKSERVVDGSERAPLDSPGAPVNDHAVSTDRPQPEGRPFTSFDLPEPVMEGIRAAGFTHCTPIQEKVLPLSLAGKDVAGQAQTGTGKTAAFLITIFTRLLRHPRSGRTHGPS